MSKQCPSCGGFCKRSGCERANVVPESAVSDKPVAEHELVDARCECCGYMTYHREHMSCIKAAYAHPAPAVDAEPVAWMYGWDGKKHLTFVDQRPIEKSYPHFNKSTPLYPHPAPAVVRQLVDGLAGLIDFIEIDHGRLGHVRLEIAKAALAAAKEAGL